MAELHVFNVMCLGQNCARGTMGKVECSQDDTVRTSHKWEIDGAADSAMCLVVAAALGLW